MVAGTPEHPCFLFIVIEDALALADAVSFGIFADLGLDAGGGQEFPPQFRRNGIFLYAELLIAAETGERQAPRIKADFFRQELPHPCDLLFLEIIAERPIAEHLEKSRVAIVTHLLDILRAEAFLRIRDAPAERMRLAEKIRHDRLHAGSGEKRRRIVFRHKRRRRHDRMPSFLEKFQIALADIFGLHGISVSGGKASSRFQTKYGG
jgi:hypothetical protein